MSTKKSFISQLAKFLRQYGDDILKGSCKLSLTTYALSLLNLCFNDARAKGDENCFEFDDDIHYVWFFLSKVYSLKIHHSRQTLCGGIDLSVFKSLKNLELHRVPVHLLTGFEKLRLQLETLTCCRSAFYLKEVFVSDASMVHTNTEIVWDNLVELNISFNNMDSFDISLNITPNITHMNASYNNFKHVDEIQILEKLMYVNLSYNLLENIPPLNSLCLYSLKVLLLKNNVLEDLNGVSTLNSLEELDVSFNCLSEHTALRHLKKLRNLRILHLEGNPIFFHERHRSLTSQFLHPKAVTEGFSLNGKSVTSRDIKSLSLDNMNRGPVLNFHQTSINVVIENSSDFAHVTEQNSYGSYNSNGNSCTSNKSDKMDKNNDLNTECNSSKKSGQNREALITDLDDSHSNEHLESTNNEVVNDENDLPLHIQMKQSLEQKRKKYKEGWLIPSHFEYFKSSEISQDTAQPAANLFNAIEEICIKNVSDEVVSQPDHCKSKEHLHTHSEFSNFQNTNEQLIQNETLEKEKNSYLQKITSYMENIKSNSDGNKCDVESCEDVDKDIFIVKKIDVNELQDMFLKVENDFIKEIDYSGEVCGCFDLRKLFSLEIKEKENVYVLSLNFNVADSSQPICQYCIEDEDNYKKILSVCKPFVMKQLPVDMNIVVYQCLNCSLKFSKQNTYQKVQEIKNPSTIAEFDLKEIKSNTDSVKEADVCSNCGSDMLIILELITHENVTVTSEHSQSSEHPIPDFSMSNDVIDTQICSQRLEHALKGSVSESKSTEATTISKKSLETSIPVESDTHALTLQKKISTDESKKSSFLNLVDIFSEKENYNSGTFTMINPRQKLNLEIKIFDQDEYLEAYLEADIMSFPTCDEFCGFLAISNKKIYIMKFLDDTKNSCPLEKEENVSEFYSMSIKHLKEIDILLGNQGFAIKSQCKKRVFIFLVRDADLCNSFHSHLTEIQMKIPNFQPKFILHSEEILNQIENEILSSYSDKSDDEPQHRIEMYLLAYWKTPDQIQNTSVCIIITQKDIILSTIEFQKCSKTNNIYQLLSYVPFEKQQILDLIEMHLDGDLLHARIYFHNENNDISREWMISTRTKASLFSFITAFKTTWEDNFGIELPLQFNRE